MSGINSAIIDWKVPTVLVVTGASRGLGAAIAVDFCKRLSKESVVNIIGRNKQNLSNVACRIRRGYSGAIEENDLDLAQYDIESFEEYFEKKNYKKYTQAILVNNAGTLGDISLPIVKCTSTADIKRYFNVNLHSAMFITRSFLNVLENVPRKVVINISSLAAIKPFKGWSLYCTGKAARDMYFRVLAEEEKSITVLNYAPGPLVTDMLTQIMREAMTEIKEQFEDARSQNQLLTPEYSVEKLIGILDRGKFKSGDHVDVFDDKF